MLHEQAEKPDHVGLLVGDHLELGELEIFEDLHKEPMKGKPHPKFEVGLKHRDSHPEDGRPSELARYHHLETVARSDVLRLRHSNRGPEIRATDLHFFFFFFRSPGGGC